MVGVPRSGGCHTCRRRRIRCDQERPFCQRCRSSNTTCEGYERWATFVNRTPAGLQKRNKLEEAIISRGGPAKATPRPGGVPATASGRIDAAGSHRGLLSRFLEIYLPVSASDRGGATETWLCKVVELAEPSPVLRLALHALAASRVGHVDGNTILIEESLKSYGESLRLLSHLLGSSGSVADEHILAASRCLMIFELFSVTTSPVGAWESHVKGLVNIAMARGPQSFTSPFSAAILADIKVGDMIGCMHHSAKSPFTHEKWRPTGVPTTMHQIELRVIHLGLDLAAFYADEESEKAAARLDRSALQDMVRRLDGICATLNKTMSLLARLNPDCGDKEFWCLESAIITAICLTLVIDSSNSIHDMLDRLATDVHPLPLNRQGLAPFTESHGPGWHEEVGWRVVSAAAYMTKADMGIYGAMRAIFPLWMMLNILPYNYAAYGRAEAVYIGLVSRWNIRHPLDFTKPVNIPNKRLTKTEGLFVQ